MSSELNVFVNQEAVGELHLEGDEYVFKYLNALESEQFVSLTMPVRVRDYVHNNLHPVFEMHLPEGYLLSIIKRHFSKLTSTDDFGLLSLLAKSIHGRVNYQGQNDLSKALFLDELLHPESESLFDELVQRFALSSPLSGVQPKVLAKVQDKATLKFDEYIVKSWGTEYPELALNEYWCMRTVQAANVPIPEFYLSDDHSLFIMKRFDIKGDGNLLGFEDMCVLQARSRDDKYKGSYEQLAKSICQFTSVKFKSSSLQQFFKMTVLNNLLQNGDAHLKNFGVIYEDVKTVRLAPAYDVVSTTAYIKNDMAALTLKGSRKWWGRKQLIEFGIGACELSLKQANALYEECIKAMQCVKGELEQALNAAKNENQKQIMQHLLGLIDQAVSA